MLRSREYTASLFGLDLKCPFIRSNFDIPTDSPSSSDGFQTLTIPCARLKYDQMNVYRVHYLQFTDKLVLAQDGREADPSQSIVLAHGVSISSFLLKYWLY